MLVKNFRFDEKGLRANARLFKSVIDAGHDLERFLEDILPYAQQANSPQAYVVKSLQNLLSGASVSRAAVPVDPVPVKAVSTKTARKPKAKPIVSGSRLSVNSAEAFEDSGLEEF